MRGAVDNILSSPRVLQHQTDCSSEGFSQQFVLVFPHSLLNLLLYFISHSTRVNQCVNMNSSVFSRQIFIVPFFFFFFKHRALWWGLRCVFLFRMTGLGF